MPIFKKREIEKLEQMSGEELEGFLASLPAKKQELESLFDYLELRLEREPCIHSLRFAMQFMMENRLNFPKVTAWLNNNGGYCDCKVLEQIVPEWRKVFEPENEE